MTEPPPRDDIGVVVRDLGPGTWRGIMVRKYGATKSAWYDEAVLLPACQQDVNKQSSRQKGGDYAMPRALQVRGRADTCEAVSTAQHSALQLLAIAYSAAQLLRNTAARLIHE